jgi:DNA polymerase-3 subunit epsilon
MTFEEMTRGEFVVLDTETTGRNKNGDDEIVSIAIIDQTGTTLLDTLVKPSRLIPEGATNVHGVTNEDVKNAPIWDEIAPKVAALITGKPLVIYNADYDLGMLFSSTKAAGLDRIEWSGITAGVWCAMKWYAEHYGEWNKYHGNYRWHRLSVAAKQTGVVVENAHHALSDCLMTLKVIRAVLKG